MAERMKKPLDDYLKLFEDAFVAAQETIDSNGDISVPARFDAKDMASEVGSSKKSAALATQMLSMLSKR